MPRVEIDHARTYERVLATFQPSSSSLYPTYYNNQPQVSYTRHTHTRHTPHTISAKRLFLSAAMSSVFFLLILIVRGQKWTFSITGAPVVE